MDNTTTKFKYMDNIVTDTTNILQKFFESMTSSNSSSENKTKQNMT